ncbi:hypothetical protein D3C84_866950 [compost metagenome]
MPGQGRVGAPVLAIEPDPAQIVERTHVAFQGLGAQVFVLRLQVAGLIQAADQTETFAQRCPLAGHADPGVQPLQAAGPAGRRDDPLGQQALKQWVNVAGS